MVLESSRPVTANTLLTFLTTLFYEAQQPIFPNGLICDICTNQWNMPGHVIRLGHQSVAHFVITRITRNITVQHR